MTGFPSQPVFAQKSQLDDQRLAGEWLTTAIELDLPLFDAERPNIYTAQSFRHEPSNYSSHAYGLRTFQNDGSFQSMASSQPSASSFELNRQDHESSLGLNYCFGNETNRASPSCPRTVPNIHLRQSLPKDPFSQEDAFPPSYYELDAQYTPQSSSFDGFPSGPSSDALTRSQYSDRNFEIHAPRLPDCEHDFIASREMTPESDMKEEPYAKRIYRCLINAPGHTMVLRDIYEWFIMNTEKGKEPEASGWKNSIRHNLSMNKVGLVELVLVGLELTLVQAFEKVNQPQGDEQKKGCSWKLADFAVKDGVKSTTRYRAKAPNKRCARTRDPDQKRMEAGAKGGQASKKAAQRRSQRLREGSHLSGPTVRQLTTPIPPPVYEVPLLGFDVKAERQPSPYFVPHSSSPNYTHQQYSNVASTSAPHHAELLNLYSSPIVPANLRSYNHLSAFPQARHPTPNSDEPFFYDSPAESSDEPITPSPMGILRMPDPFWGSQGPVEQAPEPRMEFGPMGSAVSA